MTETKPSNRDNKGRFVKGHAGGPGRKARPESIKNLAEIAPDKLAEMAKDPKTPDRLRVDILKWAFEIVYGKPAQQIDADINANVEQITMQMSVADKLKLVQQAAETITNQANKE